MKKLLEIFASLFSSLRLAVVLLIVLAVVSILGTVVPQAQDPLVYIQKYGQENYIRLKQFGFIDLYHSWGFRGLTAL
ncbi:MAG TPA: cytochrome c biogenesis protein ResB, partial [Nitrospirota bacterium]